MDGNAESRSLFSLPKSENMVFMGNYGVFLA